MDIPAISEKDTLGIIECPSIYITKKNKSVTVLLGYKLMIRGVKESEKKKEKDNNCIYVFIT